MSGYDWQAQLAKRRRRTKYERMGTLAFVVFLLVFSLWRVLYADTPEYALDKLKIAFETHDAQTVETYCDLDGILQQAYDDLTRDMFAQDDALSDQTKVMFEQFYVKIKPQVVDGTKPLLLAYVANGAWQAPAGDSILKGRQLGIDYEYLIERSQLRNIRFIDVDSVEQNDDTATAKVKISDAYTKTNFTLQLEMKKGENGWQVVKILNYRDYLDFVSPIQEAGIAAYSKATKSIITKYNDILDAQQTNFRKMTATTNGTLTNDQRNTLAGYIKSDILPAIDKRQQELVAIPVPDGGQYLQQLREEENALSQQEWNHFLTGIRDDNIAELNAAKVFHTEALNVQHRIDDVQKNTAVNKVSKSIP